MLAAFLRPVAVALTLLPAVAGAVPDRALQAAGRDATDPVKDLPLFMQVRELRKAGEYPRALAAARRMLAELDADPGAKDYELLNRRRLVRDLEEIVTLPPEAQRELGQAERLIERYGKAMGDARWTEAAAAAERMSEVFTRHLGARHHDVATAMHLLAMVRQQEGDFAGADTLFARSRGIYREILGPKAASIAMSLVAHGDLAFAAGDYVHATERYREGVRIYRAYHYENVEVIARAMTGLARVLRRRGSLQEAEAVFTEAMSLWRHGSQSGSVASNAAELADVLRARGEPERAEPLLREALRIRREQKGGDHPAVAAVLADLGDLLEGDGRHREALEVRREALSVRSRSLGPGHPDVGESLTDVASSCFHTGAAAEADSLFRAALGCFEAVAGREHAEVAEVHVGLGDVARARGNLDEAARHYGDALGVARGAYGPHHREITDTLVRMAGLAWLRDAPDEAVGPLREASRSWEHSRRLVGSAVHRATFQDSPDLLLAAALLESGRPDDAWIPMERYHGRILGDLLRAGGEAPAEPAAAPAARVAETLRPDEAMIGWVEVRPAPGRGSHWAWTLRRDGTVRWDRLPELPAGDPGADVAHRLRDALELAGSWPFRIARDPRLERAARELAAARFHSPARRLEGVTRLVVIPSGAMLGIPVELLPLAGEAVAGATVGERFAVSYAPSATVHAWLRERGARAAPGAALIVGDPPPGEGLPALPAAAREVEEVSRWMAGSRVLSGEAATEGALRDLAARDELRDFGTLHFATHALVDELRPERSALALSTHGGPDALQAALTGDPLEDGRLCAWEIVRDLRLDADLVTLSGCGTGLGKRVAGEGYLGFVHAFLQAGARSLVLSLWKVEDEATALFMDRFYAKLAEGASRVDALRDARRWLRDFRDDSGQQVYRHPAYWAAFVLVGEPG